MKDLMIDPELKDLLPPLTDEEYKRLEKNILENGFDKNFPIMEWHGYIADGHNRYSICRKHNIEPIIGTLAYNSKEEVMRWMLDIQLGRRNLSPIQRIAVTEKYRPIYERQAKENQSKAGGDKKSENYRKSVVTNPSQAVFEDSDDKERNPTVRKILSNVAGVSEDTYSKGKKILDSDNKGLKQEVLSGEKSINAGYKELTQNKKEEKTNIEREVNNMVSSTTIKPSTSQTQISEETKQICADLKTEKTKEYLDSIWDYKIDFIECMNADANMFFDTLRSHFDSLNNLVTEKELNECIAEAKKVVETINTIIRKAKTSTKIKLED